MADTSKPVAPENLASAKDAKPASAKDAKPASVKKVAKPALVTAPIATKASRKPRHWGLLASFLMIVVIPAAVSWWYLTERAVDQYASTVAFTVRSEDISSAADLFGGIGPALGATGGSTDADILYEFIRSQAMVAEVDATLGLRAYYSRYEQDDPIFGFDSEGTIEDLTTYWKRMVRISYDAGSGLMELRVLAFDPDEAKQIADSILAKSTEMINELSAIAREDATRYAHEDLDMAVGQLKSARENLTAFRIANEIVDPTADIEGQMGLLNLLQSQQVEALIEFDLLNNSTRKGDPRLDQVQRRIDVIEARIREERRKFGVGGGETQNESYAETFAEFERLAVDREFAEQRYAATLSAFDGARTESNRQSRYLAAYIKPTLAERAEFPNRALIIGIVALFSFLSWAIMSLVYYALRDRR